MIREIPDFPKPGILFRDITTLLQKPEGLSYVIDRFAEDFADHSIDYVVGIESVVLFLVLLWPTDWKQALCRFVNQENYLLQFTPWRMTWSTGLIASKFIKMRLNRGVASWLWMI